MSTAVAAGDGMALVAADKGCFICHAVKREVGTTVPLAPSYEEIAARYPDTVDAAEYLVQRILTGTVGAEQNWSDHISMRFMPPNVNVTRNEAANLVGWILGGEGTSEEAAATTAALALATNSGCMTCHLVDSSPDPRLVPLAPAFRAISARYADEPDSARYLFTAVKEGTVYSEKSWHDANMRWMPPNPQLRDQDVEALVAWILELPPAD